MTTEEIKVGQYSLSNIGGILTLFLIKRNDVVSVLDPYRYTLSTEDTMTPLPSGSITLDQAAKIYKIIFPPLTCSYSEGSENSESGMLFTPSIDFASPGNRIDVKGFLETNRDQHFVAILEDANRQAYVIGNEERGLKLTATSSINTMNTLSINLSAKLNIPTLLLETSEVGFVLADQFPDTDFGIDFSLDFNV